MDWKALAQEHGWEERDSDPLTGDSTPCLHHSGLDRVWPAGDWEGAAKDIGADWYELRDTLSPGMVFTDYTGALVMLDRRVPGDGTRWYVADLWNGKWSYMDNEIEPSDLRQRMPNPVIA